MFSVQGKTVREIALAMPVTTRVFEEFKIDYCCHGNTQFDEACLKAGASPAIVLQKIDHVLDMAPRDSVTSFTDMTLSDLIDHILDKHHVYTKAETAQLTPLMEKVATRHGEHNTFLFELKELFLNLCNDLEPHMMKEETVLFPYIQKLEYYDLNRMAAAYPPFGTVRHPVSMMTVEHEEVGDILARMRDITSDYKLPDGACPSYTALYHRLIDLERDLHQHIHLENNVLFPRAIELEQKVFG